MTYNFKRALGISFVLYIATFVIGIVSMMVSGQEMSPTASIPDVFWYVGMVSGVILSALFSLWYFKSPSVTASAKSGLLLGATAIILGFVLDLIFCAIAKMQGVEGSLMTYYGDFRFLITLVLIVGTAAYVGARKGKKMVQ